MSYRDARVKATVSGLQPASLDLTKFARSRSARFSSTVAARKVPMDSAAGALAYAALDRYEDDQGKPTGADDPTAMRRPGDPLASLLLRLKYSGQRSPDLFKQARLLLVHRHCGLEGKPTDRHHAVAAAALFEWMHDDCARCRGARRIKTRPCPAHCDRGRVSYGGLRQGLVADRTLVIDAAMAAGAMGEEAWLEVRRGQCQACGGRGYQLARPVDPRGMLCSYCGNSGRSDLKPKKRYTLMLQSGLLGRADRASLDYEAFRTYWQRHYWRLLDVLRVADRFRVGQGLDFGLFHSQNRSIESGIEEKQDAIALVERSPVGQQAEQQPAEPTGELPPQETP